jgi:hypothetical protein
MFKGVPFAMKRTSATLAIVLATALTGADARATTLERGRDGLEEIVLSVANSGADAISCGATLAHWYSQPIGTVAPGAVMTGKLWLQRESGVVFILNELEDRMPVERLWCGKDGESWSTRSEIPLERRKGESVGAIRLTCAAGPQKLECRPG